MQFSEAFEIERSEQDDWFDPDLSIDTRLFLDPFLLLDEKEHRESLFADAHDQLIEHFARCYELLAKAGAKGWGLDDGGEVGYLDIGDAVVIVPGGVDRLRHALLDAVSDEDWEAARAGFGDPDLVNE